MSNYPPSPNFGNPQQQSFGQSPFGDAPYQQTMPPPKKSKTWLIVLLVVVGCLVGIVAFCVIAGLAFELTKKELPVQARDREVVLDIQRLEQYVFGYQSNPENETFEKHRYMDDSHELFYEYEDPGDEGLYLNCTVNVEKTVSDAQTIYLSYSAGTEIGASLGAGVDVDFVERNDLFRWGDKSQLALVKVDKLPSGNFFIARKGKRVFSVTFYGVYFDDAETLRELLTPVLSKVESYQP